MAYLSFASPQAPHGRLESMHQAEKGGIPALQSLISCPRSALPIRQAFRQLLQIASHVDTCSLGGIVGGLAPLNHSVGCLLHVACTPQETIRRMFHTTSSATHALPRPPLARPLPRISLPTSASTPSLQQQQQQQQQQQTIAAAAAAAAAVGGVRRSINGAAAIPQAGQGGGYGGGDISVHALLHGSYRARYGRGEPEQAEHGHGSSSGVLMGAMPRQSWQASPGSRHRPSIFSTLPASQPPPRTSVPRPDPGTPTKAARMAVAEQGEIPEGAAPPDHLPGNAMTFQGSMHSNDLF
eukprot:scaffold1507_cov20-Tisochrysis_lutea.AAC.1